MNKPIELLSGFAIEYDAAGNLEMRERACYYSPYLQIVSENFNPSPRVYETDTDVIILVGHPIADEKRSDASVLTLLTKQGITTKSVCMIDGSFAIIKFEKNNRNLTVINDRFAGFPLYFSSRGKRAFVCSSFRTTLCYARLVFEVSINRAAIFEFLWLRKVLGQKTFVDGVKVMSAASIYVFSKAGLEGINYWQPDFTLLNCSTANIEEELSERLSNAVSLVNSDGKKAGLMLSGGLDARAILAAPSKFENCITTTLQKNNEYEVAAELAEKRGTPIVWVRREIDIFDDKLDEATSLGGMQVYNEAQFLGYGDKIGNIADVVMLGLYYDIFFGGLYLPKIPKILFGHEMFHHKMISFNGRRIDDVYLSNVKYRLKSSSLVDVLKPDICGTLIESLRNEISCITNQAAALGADNLQQWEYLHTHNLSRHYSFPMVTSVRTFAECRLPAFTNDLFNLSYGIDNQLKIDGTLYQNAITRMAPDLMLVRNANTNLPAYMSLRRQSYAKILSHINGKMGLGGVVRSPGWQDRSWPSPSHQFFASIRLVEKAKSLPNDLVLQETGIFDHNGLEKVVSEHISGEADHTVLVNLLLTISNVLRPATVPAN